MNGRNNNMKKCIPVICIICMLLLNMVSIKAAETVLSIDSVNAGQGGSVDVPIRISGNSGIAGAVIRIDYDSSLTLTGVKKGTAFSDLTLTPPKDYSVKPVTLVWDGIDADATNGIIAILTFTVPEGSGFYGISASYAKGGIYDGALNDIDVLVTNGGITVGGQENELVINGVSPVSLSLRGEETGAVCAALYKSGKLIEINVMSAAAEITPQMSKINEADTLQVMWWRNMTDATPMCPMQILNLDN